MSEKIAPAAEIGPVAPSRWLELVAFVLAVIAQLVVLYSPSAPGGPPFPAFDKITHLLIFGAPVVAAAAALHTWRWVPWVLVVHAPISEIIQYRLLADRQGDPLDAVADLAGVAAGLVVARRWVRRNRW